jgi:hypothetical protein
VCVKKRLGVIVVICVLGRDGLRNMHIYVVLCRASLVGGCLMCKAKCSIAHVSSVRRLI